jgi:hypothetical protein
VIFTESDGNLALFELALSCQYPETGQLTDFKWISQSKNVRRESRQNRESGTGFETFFRIRAEDELSLSVRVRVG